MSFTEPLPTRDADFAEIGTVRSRLDEDARKQFLGDTRNPRMNTSKGLKARHYLHGIVGGLHVSE
jgi:hypothetical protein